jgi:hypothetical protein
MWYEALQAAIHSTRLKQFSAGKLQNTVKLPGTMWGHASPQHHTRGNNGHADAFPGA